MRKGTFRESSTLKIEVEMMYRSHDIATLTKTVFKNSCKERKISKFKQNMIYGHCKKTTMSFLTMRC